MLAQEALPSDSPASLEALLDRYAADRSVLSSVIAHDPRLEEVLAERTRFHKLGHASQLPFTSPVARPDTIGADRLAICAAAVSGAPAKHKLAIAVGTCITYNFIDKYERFLGGGISPGLRMRFGAMHAHTALLPLVEPRHDFPLIGYDTNTNLQSGVILGMCKEIDGIIGAYRERYEALAVWLTGGDMSFFLPHLRETVVADADLLFKGLYGIAEANC